MELVYFLFTHGAHVLPFHTFALMHRHIGELPSGPCHLWTMVQSQPNQMIFGLQLGMMQDKWLTVDDQQGKIDDNDDWNFPVSIIFFKNCTSGAVPM